MNCFESIKVLLRINKRVVLNRYESDKSILKRFSNCFSKAISNDKSNKLTEKKKMRLNEDVLVTNK